MGDERNLDLLLNVALGVRAELGRCTLRVSEVLELGRGSVVTLDRLAGDPIDVLVNDRLVARGEIVAVDDRFGVRITDVVARKAVRPGPAP
ncbi:MAG: flagellar motor switch protein FliN [Candidatus Eremiobacteraeota bacterium]|nr:flagellar motor switch protein FliN [Candidatus Eremiobacteraeota bacterium]MBC5801615.1 flagellar motor switch protein FliN [Candidatus Eremiobacteraeota bacterium]MBC5821069.1 flagellar motor switch protein FliN [Candidatus Eremiobacteraeota bacterium]